jgi:hypothetical protein
MFVSGIAAGRGIRDVNAQQLDWLTGKLEMCYDAKSCVHRFELQANYDFYNKLLLKSHRLLSIFRVIARDTQITDQTTVEF